VANELLKGWAVWAVPRLHWRSWRWVGWPTPRIELAAQASRRTGAASSRSMNTANVRAAHLCRRGHYRPPDACPQALQAGFVAATNAVLGRALPLEDEGESHRELHGPE